MMYLPRDIRQMKLANGDEILTEVSGEDAAEFLVRNPLRVYKEKQISETGMREANMFSRWMGFAENDEVIISKTHIIAEAIVNDMVASHYNRMVNNTEDEDIEDTNGEDYGNLLDMVDTETVH